MSAMLNPTAGIASVPTRLLLALAVGSLAVSGCGSAGGRHDGKLVSAPSINYTHYPQGINASTGSQISAGFTIAEAQELAGELEAAALPLRLVLIERYSPAGS
jgi:hypothetical protein